jgi:hypothetical protein
MHCCSSFNTLPVGTSVGLLGLGGYCTGKVVAVGATSTLHPTGKALLGYPCIEHTGPVLDLLHVISNTHKGNIGWFVGLLPLLKTPSSLAP